MLQIANLCLCLYSPTSHAVINALPRNHPHIFLPVLRLPSGRPFLFYFQGSNTSLVRSISMENFLTKSPSTGQPSLVIKYLRRCLTSRAQSKALGSLPSASFIFTGHLIGTTRVANLLCLHDLFKTTVCPQPENKFRSQ